MPLRGEKVAWVLILSAHLNDPLESDKVTRLHIEASVPGIDRKKILPLFSVLTGEKVHRPSAPSSFSLPFLLSLAVSEFGNSETHHKGVG